MDEQRPCETLARGKAIIQYFRVGDEYLIGIRMISMTYHRQVRRKVIVRLYEISAGLDDGALSYDTLKGNHATLIASDERKQISDNEQFILNVDPNSAQCNAQYGLYIDGGESIPGTEVTLWLYQRDHQIDGHISSWSGEAHQREFGLRGIVMTA